MNLIKINYFLLVIIIIFIIIQSSTAGKRKAQSIIRRKQGKDRNKYFEICKSELKRGKIEATKRLSFATVLNFFIKNYTKIIIEKSTNVTLRLYYETVYNEIKINVETNTSENIEKSARDEVGITVMSPKYYCNITYTDERWECENQIMEKQFGFQNPNPNSFDIFNVVFYNLRLAALRKNSYIKKYFIAILDDLQTECKRIGLKITPVRFCRSEQYYIAYHFYRLNSPNINDTETQVEPETDIQEETETDTQTETETETQAEMNIENDYTSQGKVEHIATVAGSIEDNFDTSENNRSNFSEVNNTKNNTVMNKDRFSASQENYSNYTKVCETGTTEGSKYYDDDDVLIHWEVNTEMGQDIYFLSQDNSFNPHNVDD